MVWVLSEAIIIGFTFMVAKCIVLLTLVGNGLSEYRLYMLFGCRGMSIDSPS